MAGSVRHSRVVYRYWERAYIKYQRGQSHKWSYEVKFALMVVLTNNFDSDAKTCTRADGIGKHSIH